MPFLLIDPPLQDRLREQGAFVSVREVSEEVIEPYRAIRELAMLRGKPDLSDETTEY